MFLYGINSWLSGFGETKSRVENRAQFLVDFIKEASLGQPVIVSPSMSGSFSIPYMMSPDGSTCQQRLKAFIPVAPGQTEQVTHDEYKKCKVRVYGEWPFIQGDIFSSRTYH